MFMAYVKEVVPNIARISDLVPYCTPEFSHFHIWFCMKIEHKLYFLYLKSEQWVQFGLTVDSVYNFHDFCI
jgi:hypothetical protein